MLLDMADPDRARDLCFGTVDTWVAWTLSGGALHVTDATNAGGHRSAAPVTERTGTTPCSTRCASPASVLPAHRRLVGRGGRGQRRCAVRR